MIPRLLDAYWRRILSHYQSYSLDPKLALASIKECIAEYDQQTLGAS